MASYKRILLKVSGEILADGGAHVIDDKILSKITDDIIEAYNLGVQIAVVIGGGNICRGRTISHTGMNQVDADYMGMVGTCINAIAIQSSLESKGIQTRIQSAITMTEISEPYIRRRAIRHLEKGRIVLFAAGTGNPYFSTDTAASLRAMEIGADVVLKGTKVDGIYDKDPLKDKNSKMYKEISHDYVVKQGLKVMDATAITLCMDNKLPIIIFNIKQKGNIARVLKGESLGTIIK